VTRDEVLAWLDGHVGDDVGVSTDVAPGGVASELLSASGVLGKDPVYGGLYTVGGATVDTRVLNDAQLDDASPGFRENFPHESLRIPLAEGVSLLLDYEVWDPG